MRLSRRRTNRREFYRVVHSPLLVSQENRRYLVISRHPKLNRHRIRERYSRSLDDRSFSLPSPGHFQRICLVGHERGITPVSPFLSFSLFTLREQRLFLPLRVIIHLASEENRREWMGGRRGMHSTATSTINRCSRSSPFASNLSSSSHRLPSCDLARTSARLRNTSRR